MIVQAFIDKLRSNGVEVKKLPKTKNVYQTSVCPMIYIKQGSAGFWGLTENVIQRLNDSGAIWKAVLLKTQTTGYVLDKESINTMISQSHVTLSKDGDYKLNEGSEINYSEILSSFEEIMRHLTESSIDLHNISRVEEEEQVIDIIKNMKKEQLRTLIFEITDVMKNPQKHVLLVEQFRRNNALRALLKALNDFSCQFCGFRIKLKNGGYYVEEAHIVPLYEGGSDTPDNILILCPNHHKMLDYAHKRITRFDNLVEVTFMDSGETYKVTVLG